MRLYGILIKPLLAFLVFVLIGATARFSGGMHSKKQRIYFANHTSHLDTVALWFTLPRSLRDSTSPVAAKDYWTKGPIRRYIANKILQAVLIERKSVSGNPLTPAFEALERGKSLIIFPEGTRTPQRLPGEFKGGLYLLAKQFPEVELIPVYLENLYRSMPKGAFLPVPVSCSVWFGQPIRLEAGEAKAEFLHRARKAVEDLACQ